MSRARWAEASGGLLGALWAALPGLLAVALLAVGAWMAWPPAGPMAAGAVLLADRMLERVWARPRGES